MPSEYEQYKNATTESAYNRVQVNQRALIDKILARYATASAVYRELLQNSNDANATRAVIEFVTNNKSNKVESVKYSNNGFPFRDQDWKRLQSIAEGNPDESKIGAFGVGAYSMFSIADEPVVVSGDTVLLFCWQGDALYTKIGTNDTKTTKDSQKWTSFLLPSRDPYDLPDLRVFGEFLISALTFTEKLTHITVKVNYDTLLEIDKTLHPKTLIQLPKNSHSFWNTAIVTSQQGLFVCKSQLNESLVSMKVTYQKTQFAQLEARYIVTSCNTNVPRSMAKRMHRVTKKDPPKTVNIQIFLNATTLQPPQNDAERIAQSFLPNHGNGKIFIGFKTSQSTGLASHIAAPFLPTVEREAMDLQDATLKVFNLELLDMAGILLRWILEHRMRTIGTLYQETAAQRNEWERLHKNDSARQIQQQQQEVETVSTTTDETGPSFLGFAKYMARGVTKKIQSVAQTIGGDGLEHLLHPPDARPLNEPEESAILLMRSFCPQPSTPDPSIGSVLATGFTRCLNTSPPVLTRTGVVNGNAGFLPFYGIEGFVETNVIRQVVYDNAREYHDVIAHCRKLKFDDLMTVVSKTVLEQETAYNQPQQAHRRGQKLKDAIRYYETKDAAGSDTPPQVRTPQSIRDFLFYLNDESLKGLPLPNAVLPRKLQQSITWPVLKSDNIKNVWFESLPFEIFTEFISHHPAMSQAKPEDELLRIKILQVLCREFTNRSGPERSVFGGLCHSVLAKQRCIPFDSDVPSQDAASVPSDLYLYSAELKAFDGVGSFHKASASLQSAGVTEEFLLALGVRKSVSIDFLFSHLDTLSWSRDPKSLIEYLRTATLNRSDLHKLSTTRYLPSANDNSTYAPSELYLPNESLCVFPFIKRLQWPSEPEVSDRSENGKFLVKLGMKVLPSLSTVLSFVCGGDLTQEQRQQGLEFICERLSPHGAYYSQYNIMSGSEKKKYRFLPCVVNNLFTTEPVLHQKCSPVDCFSDPQCGVMGFPILDPTLGKNAKLYGSLFQCSSEPPPELLLHQLAHLVALSKSKLNAASGSELEHLSVLVDANYVDIFNYMSHRCSDLNYSSLGRLAQDSFIPRIVEKKIHWYRPDEVFFEQANGNSDTITAELFPVIPFSPFLAAAGVKQDATTKEIFRRMIKDPEGVLQTLGSETKYRSLLRRVAADPPFSISRASAEIRRSPFLLAYTVKAFAEEKSDTDGSSVSEKTTFSLAEANEIFIVDNSNYARLFPVKRAPPETDLEDFYAKLGSQYISKAVERRYEIVGKPRADTDLTRALRDCLDERGPLLVSPNVTSRPLVSGASSVLSAKRLEIYEATNILAVHTLGKISRRNRTTCFSRSENGRKNAIFVTPDYDMFDVGHALGDLILKRCQLEDAFFICSLLEASLDQLRSRGFPVDRIIKPVEEPPPAGPMDPPPPQEPAPPPPTQTKANPPDTMQEESKADIVSQMFPDANMDYIKGALGENPSLDQLRGLVDYMSRGTYPRSNEDAKSEAATNSTVDDAESQETAAKKKKSIRKRIGQAFSGKRGSNFGGMQLPNVPTGGTVRPPSNADATATENRGPVSPASDANTQNVLESMLEQSVNSATRVQKRDIESPETNLTSIPQELDRGETCEVLPGHSLKPYAGPLGNGRTRNGIVVFSSKQHTSSERFLTENDESLTCFSKVIEDLCLKVFGLKLESVAIYHDPGGPTIAFNSNRAIHVNLRFFHALHYISNKHASSDCYSYWFVTICHELAHNFVSAHSKEHGFYTESFAGKYLPKLLNLLQARKES